ncbi:MAG: arsenate reductase family protein [Thermoplasmatota archaeon]
MALRLYYNAKCATCRRAKEILEERKVPFELVHYMEEPPNAEEWQRALRYYEGEPMDFLRTRDPLYGELKLETKHLGADQVARLLAKHPQLLARPIAVQGRRAIVARPAAKVLEVT